MIEAYGEVACEAAKYKHPDGSNVVIIPKDERDRNVPFDVKREWKFDTVGRCGHCEQVITGALIINKKDLGVTDTSGFIIMVDSLVCDKCLERFKRGKA